MTEDRIRIGVINEGGAASEWYWRQQIEAIEKERDELKDKLAEVVKERDALKAKLAGYLRPGKDESPQSGHTYEECQAAWYKWVDDHVAAARKLLEGK